MSRKEHDMRRRRESDHLVKPVEESAGADSDLHDRRSDEKEGPKSLIQDPILRDDLSDK